jgi:predicted small secreted protein
MEQARFALQHEYATSPPIQIGAIMKKILFTLAALCGVAVLTTACNTMQGAGKDIERAGEKIQDSAQKNK